MGEGSAGKISPTMLLHSENRLAAFQSRQWVRLGKYIVFDWDISVLL